MNDRCTLSFVTVISYGTHRVDVNFKEGEIMSLLKINHLSHAFGDHQVLHDINLTANQGDVIVLLGNSGSGKSTLLRCINQLNSPKAGVIQFQDQRFQFPIKKISNKIHQKNLSQLRTHVGMVFQHFNLWPHKTVLDNLITAPMKVLKKEKSSATQQAHELLKTVGLFDKKDAYPVNLSGGQQQRIAIARGLMMKPDLMLFDEPTSALDPENINEVLSVIQQLAQQGMTLIIATHELNFAKKVASHVVFLQQGKIVESGNVSMMDQPQTERFKQFLNAMLH